MNTPVYTPPADARISASLLLLRDGAAGLEVLMLRRAERDGDMRSGAAVFPGGVVDVQDRQAHAHTLGLDDASASRALGLSEGGLDYWVAALRETFEEVGLLLADRDLEAQRLKVWRGRLQQGSASIAQMCHELDLQLDARELIYFSHWLTPPGQPKRFDTRFFIVQAPAGQVAEADLGEALELMWLTPQQALDPARQLKLLPVTRRTLQELGQCANVADALATARARGRVELTMPRIARTAKGPRAVLPDEPAYAEVARLDPTGRHDVSCELLPGPVVRLSERLWRVTAPNGSIMTGPGTNTYLVGSEGQWTVVDPGPTSATHLEAVLAALAQSGGHLERILVTHTHKDHSPGAAALAQATGVPVWGRRPLYPEWQDEHFAPQREPAPGERIAAGPGCTLRVVHTPGHASNHLCYLLEEEKTLLTGDHVMQGSTVVINPPDGDMQAYMASLQALLALDLDWLAPGHGFLMAQPHAAIRRLIAHRLQREAKVLAALQAGGPTSLQDLLGRVYDDVPANRLPVAARSLLAHLQKLAADGRARETAEGVWAAL